MMDKKDAIDYLLYMKHDVQAGSPVDVAIDTAIEALKATVKQTKTNGDKIRAMTDDEELLSAIGTGCYRCAYRNDECDSGYGEGCIAGNLKWLKQEVSEGAAERTD
jgi:hypothetical protein